MRGFRPTLVVAGAILLVLTAAPARADHGSGQLIDARCNPDGTIVLARGQNLEIDLFYFHGNDASAGYFVTFTAAMNTNIFFPGVATFNSTQVFGGGGNSNGHQVLPALTTDTSSMTLGTDRVVITVTSDATGSTVLAECDFMLTLIDPAGDADGDGLRNDWETGGLDANNDGLIDLAIDKSPFDARWNHKDLFVEIDSMNSAVAGSGCGTAPTPSCPAMAQHSHRPMPDAVNDVVGVFAAAPVTNPDGKNGITLHAMVDEDIPDLRSITFMTEGTGPGNDFNDLKVGDPAVACDGFFGTVSERGLPTIPNVNCANILAARRKVFRYAVFGHRFDEAPSALGVGELPGNDLLMTLDGDNVVPPITSTRLEQASTLLHEFGHSLGLRHGGVDHINCKPNYISVMNYSYDSFVLDYSRQRLDPLDETSLSEPKGIAGPAGVLARYGLNGKSRSAPANGPIDWNGNGAATETGVRADVNYETAEMQGACGPSADQTLTGYDDWANLTYAIGTTLDFADGPARTTPHTTPDQSIAEFRLGLDGDGDGIKDGTDNCPGLSNPDQANHDTDANGDSCDTDDDNDGLPDTLDNCPIDANTDQADLDGDGIGDVCDPLNTVPIDIKPDSSSNSINRSSSGTVPVAILSTALFDAPSRVVRTSLTFGRTGEEASLRKCNANPEDVNGDGRYDLVCHFLVARTGFTLSDTVGVLRGTLLNGIRIQGSDTVRMRP